MALTKIKKQIGLKLAITRWIMETATMQISNAVQEVAEITQKNKTSINDLVQEVGKFKV